MPARTIDDERGQCTVSAAEIEMYVKEAQGHHWRAAADELNYTLLDAYDMGRGGILGNNGVITSVDELEPSYGD